MPEYEPLGALGAGGDEPLSGETGAHVSQLQGARAPLFSESSLRKAEVELLHHAGVAATAGMLGKESEQRYHIESLQRTVDGLPTIMDKGTQERIEIIRENVNTNVQKLPSSELSSHSEALFSGGLILVSAARAANEQIERGTPGQHL